MTFTLLYFFIQKCLSEILMLCLVAFLSSVAFLCYYWYCCFCRQKESFSVDLYVSLVIYASFKAVVYHPVNRSLNAVQWTIDVIFFISLLEKKTAIHFNLFYITALL